MTAIIKQPVKRIEPGEAYISYMYVSYLRAPAGPTREEVKRGANIDLGEIGTVPETRAWSRATRYSPARTRTVLNHD